MQSWTTFTGGKSGYFAIVSAVSKYGHLYQTPHETGGAVINSDQKNSGSSAKDASSRPSD